MRFSFQATEDGSLTVFDQEAGECFKSRHAARTEAEHVFFGPGVWENPLYSKAHPFRILELGLGLGTNFLHCLTRDYKGEFLTIERDLAGLEFYLSENPQSDLEELKNEKTLKKNGMSATLLVADFEPALKKLAEEGYRAHCIFFDPFSPRANPTCWTPAFFRLAGALLAPGGRLVTYSVSRAAKDGVAAAGLLAEKRELPPSLKKRAALLAWKPLSE